MDSKDHCRLAALIDTGCAPRQFAVCRAVCRATYRERRTKSARDAVRGSDDELRRRAKDTHVFGSKPGAIEGFKVQLRLRGDATPVFRSPRQGWQTELNYIILRAEVH